MAMTELERIKHAIELAQAARYIASGSNEHVAGLLVRNITQALNAWGDPLPTDEEAYDALTEPTPSPTPTPSPEG